MERVESHGCAGGRQEVWRHASETLGCEMKFGIYLPPQALHGDTCPVVYWLSGLTCTEQNFITKAGAQAHAATLGLVLVVPDTSPRGPGVADDPAYDLGQGAGFYLNATEPPWAPHYRMQDYVADELPALVAQHFPITAARGIAGHSMGGHGALVTAMRHPGRYRSVSAFAPIVAPAQVPWGRKALTAYLGADERAWARWDAVSLIRALPQGAERLDLWVDQGEDDEFLAQLRPDLLEQACRDTGHPLTLRRHAGYDHSYYFVASFIGEHLNHHAKALT
jgi:S-formylglutathione hydrolase